MATRKDIHSPKSFDPGAYRYDGTFVINAGGSEFSEIYSEIIADAMDYAFGSSNWLDVDALLADQKASGFAGNFALKRTCDHCGAHFNYGAAFTHEASGEIIAVGHTCAANSFGVDTRRAYDMKKAKRAIKMAKDRAEGLDYIESIGLATVLDPAHAKRHRILSDFRDKAIRWKRLSEKQIALARKIATEIDTPDTCDFCKAEGHDEKHCPNIGSVPEAGKHKGLEGVVLGTRCDEASYGYHARTVYKWLVRLDNGSKLWGSVPSGIWDYVETLSELRGLRVSFNATIKPKEKSFAIASYPGCGKVVLTAEENAAYESAAATLLADSDAAEAMAVEKERYSDSGMYSKADQLGAIRSAARRFLDAPTEGLIPNLIADMAAKLFLAAAPKTV